MRIISVSLFSIFLFLFGCSLKEQNYFDKYLILESQFDSLKINHFPDMSLNFEEFEFKINRPESAKKIGSCGAFLAVKVDNEFIEKIEKSFVDSVIDSYDPADRCLLRVNLLQNETAGNNFLEYYNNQCGDNYLPTPNFIDKLNDHSLLHYSENGFLHKNFKLFILEAKQGEYIDSAYLTNGIGLPSKWKNGLTKGIALNKRNNIVIYWLEIW